MKKGKFCPFCCTDSKIGNICLNCGKIDETCPACKTVNTINDDGFCEYCGYIKGQDIIEPLPFTNRIIH